MQEVLVAALRVERAEHWLAEKFQQATRKVEAAVDHGVVATSLSRSRLSLPRVDSSGDGLYQAADFFGLVISIGTWKSPRRGALKKSLP